MTRITVDAGFQPFAGRCAALRAQLIDLVAQRDGLVIRGVPRADFFREQATRRADDLITAWERDPRNPKTQIDAILVQMSENAAALVQHRQSLAAEREQLKPQPVEPNPDLVRVQFRCELSGKAIRLDIPRAMVVALTA